jgi:hypothetical protein
MDVQPDEATAPLSDLVTRLSYSLFADSDADVKPNVDSTSLVIRTLCSCLHTGLRFHSLSPIRAMSCGLPGALIPHTP